MSIISQKNSGCQEIQLTFRTVPQNLMQ